MSAKRVKTVKPLTFEYPAFGYNLMCFRCYMFVGDLDGNLKIDPQPFQFGAHVFIPGESEVTQIGDENDSHALWIMLRLEGGFSLRYLGIFEGDTGKMLMFEPLLDGKPRAYQRNLFGDLADCEYKNLFVAFNIISGNELVITTSALAPRCFRPTVVFVPKKS